MMLITGESLQNLTNIVNAVVISIDCRRVRVLLYFMGFIPFLQRTEAVILKWYKVLMELQAGRLFWEEIVPKCYWTIIKMHPLCAVREASFSVCIRTGSLRSLWVLSRQPCLNDILTSVQQHSHYLLRGLKSIWNYFKRVRGINLPQTALTSSNKSIIFINTGLPIPFFTAEWQVKEVQIGFFDSKKKRTTFVNWSQVLVFTSF